MSDFDLPTKLQLTNCCDQIQAVVDALPTHTDATLTNRWRLLPPIKSLFTSLQRLEDDETRPDGAFNTADAFAKRNLGRIITSCSVVANQIQIPNSSRHNDSFGIELMTLLKNQIEDFLTLRNTRPNPGTSPCSSAPTEDHLTKQQEHESEDEAFRNKRRSFHRRESSFEEEIISRDKLIAELRDHNETKLSHIRRLHAAILNLGVRHPMIHQTHNWEDLSYELPFKLQWIQNINAKLKELELEQDKRNGQQHDSEEEEIYSAAVPLAPMPPAVSGSKLPAKSKDKDAKRNREHRRTADGGPSVKFRSPSPASSETSRAHTSKSARGKSRTAGTGSGAYW